MFISIPQLELSLQKINKIHPFFGISFLAFKKAKIPVNKTTTIVFSKIANNILNKHYKPSTAFNGYYNPFQTSDKDNRWNAPRYGSTSLQRITADTFGDVFLHPKKSSEWGWQLSYVSNLKKHLADRLIPAFDLAVWLYKDIDWPDAVTPKLVINYFFDDFDFTENEIAELFDLDIELSSLPWTSESPLTEREIYRLIGTPPGLAPEEGAALLYVKLQQIGPADNFVYEPGERLNLITGDNSLGKTFVLDCIWWSLTGEWLRYPVLPRKTASKNVPKISFAVTSSKGKTQEFSSNFNWESHTWALPKNREAVAGLIIYAGYDGSFAVWDPARSFYSGKEVTAKINHTYTFTREDIWYGLPVEGKREWLCNGLLRDWVTWQRSGKHYEERWKALIACLNKMSPSYEPITPGEPTKLPFNELEIPTLQLPYGEVPIINASAGVMRAVALAYILIWSWYKHLENSQLIRKEPQKRIVVLIDEVEAHLHPKWQRVIVPSIIDVLAELSPAITPQVHIATHSPLVLASSEPIFDEATDGLHHLSLHNKSVSLDKIDFVKRGKADHWLMSDVFELEQARSLPAENAIKEATGLQLEEKPSPEAVREANVKLIKYLAEDDDFWPRWRFFAQKYGA